MHKIEIPDRDLTLELPSNWYEATPAQAAKLFKLAFKLMTNQIGKNDYIVESLFFLTGMKRNWRIKVWESMAPAELVLEKNAKLYEMGNELCMWPFDSEIEEPRIKYETVINNLPEVMVGRKRLLGPSTLLADLTFVEFRTAIEQMNTHTKLAKDPEAALEAEEALNRFIACLYRPAKRRPLNSNEPLVREAFNRSRIKTKFAAKLPIWQKSMILLWFSYCIKYIQSEDIELEGRVINLSPLFPPPPVIYTADEEPTNNDSLGWVSLVFAIAEKNIFGDAKATDSQNLFDILAYMYDSHLKQQKQNRR